MWNPKRILLLVFGIVVFTSAFGIYTYFLGGVDGLPELPEMYVEPADKENPKPLPSFIPDVDRKLQMAFGPDCPELRRTIKLDIRAKGIVLAADQFTIIRGGPRDGQVELRPFSVVTFGKSRGDGQFPEINTVRSDVAYLTFDQPITTAAEMGSHKVIGGELVCQVNDDGAVPVRSGEVGGVRIVNNRRTPQRDDDLTLFTPGPVFFQEALHKIWTQEAVILVDEQSKPKPTRINAMGMDVYLLTEEEQAASGKAPPGKKKGDKPAAPPKTEVAAGKKNDKPGNISGVKGVLLRSNVHMFLTVDGNSNFLGGPSKPTAPAAAKANGTTTPAAGTKPPAGGAVASKAPDKKDKAPAGPREATGPKDPVTIHTQGPFYYDALAETARFDVSQHPGPHPNHVEVVRGHEGSTAQDHLICNHLELQFVRKPTAEAQGPAAAAGDSRSMELEIETAHAWGEQTTLTSDDEVLTVFADDLVHNTKTRETILKGGTSDLIALKDGNQITAHELVIMGATNDKEGQQARAIGPGIVEMLNKQAGKRTQRALFRDELLVTKEGRYDLLTLTGEAAFEDIEHGQHLKGERLKVWLEPADPQPATPKGPAPASDSPSQHRRPHHLEAVGHVSAWSPGEMNVHDTDRLVVFFEDAPTPAATAAAPAAVVGTSAAPAPPPPTTTVDKPTVDPAPVATAPAPTNAPAGTPAADAEKPKKPMDLRARYVEAHIRRLVEKNELERLWCEGDVRARQEPTGPTDEGSDIRGDTLQLLSFPEGHILTVTGDLAEVKLDKLNIIGPEVNIDQKENKAWVNGLGSMRMPSDTSLTSGEKLTKPTELTVYWNRDMFFNGKYALFHGGVQAEQENGRLACHTMQVYLDRFVSLRQSEKKDGTPAKVSKLVCDKSVRVEDRKLDEKTGKLLSYQRLINPVLSLDNEDNVVVGPGPGEVRLLQPGDKDDAEQGPGVPARRPAAGQPAKEEELKLTRITYIGRMFANNNSRTAIFYDNVEVISVPSEDPNLELNPDKALPKGGLYLSCDLLKVYSRRDAAGKTHQEMEARGKSLVRSDAFWGRADVIKYDESKDLVVFESSEGNLSTLYKQEVVGGQPQEFKGRKIYYWRKSNLFRVEDGTGMMAPNFNTAPAKKPAPTPKSPAGSTGPN